ncbi:hypothetical protein LCGC14_0451000 [marine sediment metagenome]|uniref:Uncharacterized protein n=1 Tax=marine sediment metagenome TaxID=412755 RepID=A0A0F9SN71_9ZZZZ
MWGLSERVRPCARTLAESLAGQIVNEWPGARAKDEAEAVNLWRAVDVELGGGVGLSLSET